MKSIMKELLCTLKERFQETKNAEGSLTEMRKTYNVFMNSLTHEQKQLYLEFESAVNILHANEELDAYANGVKTGIFLACEFFKADFFNENPVG